VAMDGDPQFLFAWIFTNPDGIDEICSALVSGVLVPMLALSLPLAERWRRAAADVARRYGGNVRLVRFVSTEPRRGYVSPRDSELADAVYRSWCNGRPLIEGVADACAIAREEGRADTGSRER
jgi:hypothetical protein